MFKGKVTKVIVVDKAKKDLANLNEVVNEEINKGILKSSNQILLKSINNKVDILKNNPEFGLHISKNKIPKDYVRNYDVNNLWKINLSGAWRLIYTIKGSEVEILSIILDIFNHRKYEKKFNYKKS